MKRFIAFLLCIIIITLSVSCDSDNAGSRPSENEIAMQMYEAAIRDEICVFDKHLGEVRLKDCHFMDSDLSLKEILISGKAVLDMDGDGTDEFIIITQDLDKIILRYHNGKVYSYSFAFESMNNLKKDGSFYWKSTEPKLTENFVGLYDSGARRIFFDGCEMRYEDIYKTVYDDNFEKICYIGSDEVSQNQLTEYVTTLSNEFLEYTPFEAPWYKALTVDDAVRIGYEYWGIAPGEIDEDSGYKMAVLPKFTDGNVYAISLSLFVEEDHYSTVEIIGVHGFTGEIVELKGK